MAPRIHERTRDRISAVQVLYTSELTGKSPSELLDCGLCLVARGLPPMRPMLPRRARSAASSGTLTDYALALIRGVRRTRQAQVDEREAASENWAPPHAHRGPLHSAPGRLRDVPLRRRAGVGLHQRGGGAGQGLRRRGRLAALRERRAGAHRAFYGRRWRGRG